MIKILKRKKKSKLNPGVFASRSVSDKIVYGIAVFFLAVVCLTQFYLVFWMCYTALKDDIDMYISMFALPRPDSLHFENFSNVIKLIRVELFVPSQGYVSFGIPTLFINSILLAFFMPLQGQLVTTICAYIFAKYRFKGRNLMLKINYFVIIFPIVGSLASSLKINTLLGRYDNFLLMCIMGAHPFTGLGLLIQMSFYSAIPKEMMEAARMDGAGHLATYFRIHFPIMLPTIFLYYVLAIFGAWNDYMTPLVWLPSFPNIALGVYQFQYDAAKYAATLPQILAAFIMMSIPSVIFYLCNQRLIASKMVMAGLKG